MRSIKREKNYLASNYSLTKAILDLLLGAGEQIGAQNQNAWRSALGAPKIQNWRLKRAFNYLEQRGQIQKSLKQKSEFYVLTKDGKLKALLNKMKQPTAPQVQWDGKWRIIIWDIPEQQRLYRDYLRKWVKEMGFVKLQQSVFVRPSPIPQEAVDYLHEVGIDKYIRFVRVDKIDSDGELRRHFKLN